MLRIVFANFSKETTNILRIPIEYLILRKHLICRQFPLNTFLVVLFTDQSAQGYVPAQCHIYNNPSSETNYDDLKLDVYSWLGLYDMIDYMV